MYLGVVWSTQTQAQPTKLVPNVWRQRLDRRKDWGASSKHGCHLLSSPSEATTPQRIIRIVLLCQIQFSPALRFGALARDAHLHSMTILSAINLQGGVALPTVSWAGAQAGCDVVQSGPLCYCRVLAAASQQERCTGVASSQPLVINLKHQTSASVWILWTTSKWLMPPYFPFHAPAPHTCTHAQQSSNCQCLFTGSRCCSAASGANEQPRLISRVVPVDVIINEAAFKSWPLSGLKLCCVSRHKAAPLVCYSAGPWRRSGTEVAAAVIRTGDHDWLLLWFCSDAVLIITLNPHDVAQHSTSDVSLLLFCFRANKPFKPSFLG